jgi:Arc/MetJ family transcription regulator
MCKSMCEIKLEGIMATNLAIDNDLIETAKRIGGHKTKKAVVTEALQEYIRVRRQREIVKLFNKIDYDPDYDYKAQRNAQ